VESNKIFLVSFIIPCYNAEKWIAEAIESCLSQAYKSIELIIINDGSTDNSLSVIQSFADRYPNIIRYKSQPNKGQAETRNKAIEMARGKYVLFLDADDILSNASLEFLLTEAEKREDAGVVYGNVCYVDEKGKHKQFHNQVPIGRDWVFNMMLGAPKTSGVLLKTNVARQVKFDKALPNADEFAYFVDLAIKGATFSHINETLAHIRHYYSESRVSCKTEGQLPHLLADLFIRFQKDLIEKQQYTRQREIVINRAFLDLSLVLFRHPKTDRDFAKGLYNRADKALIPLSRHYKKRSLVGLAVATNLEFACFIADVKDYIYRVLPYFRKFGSELINE
jgi:glycosyltransferase involved in cell wall biosynthesis